VTTPPDAQRLVEQLMADPGSAESRALLEGLLDGRVSSLLEKLQAVEAPRLLPVPAEVRGFRVRLDLSGAEPPVWRRLELPGDLDLPALHDVIQSAMGWYDCHLHRFRTGSDPRAPGFVTNFDVEEGEEGTLEDGVRLDQLVAQQGDQLWYEYDFGDGWEHRLVVEAVLDEPPAAPRCTGGRMACPPEDCGGIGGYQELAAWVRSGYDAAHLPAAFDGPAHAHSWLPDDWDPDAFDPARVDLALAAAAAEPAAVTGELASLVEELERHGSHQLREVLARPLSHGPTDVGDEQAARLTGTYRTFLDVIGDGVTLTAAGYLPPAVVEQLADRLGVSEWWFGRANREDLTFPVAHVRTAARALGLVSLRKGRLSPTAAARRLGADPQALRCHVVSRLPLGTSDADRQAGWMALAVTGSGVPAGQWRGEVTLLLHALGWRDGDDRVSPPPAHSPTLDVLEHLAGGPGVRTHHLQEVDPAVAATARAVTAPR
jgi:hypothetical protein